MRQIEFRAWNGESMHYGGFSVHATGLVESTVFAGDIVNLMQFTGLHDKNGVNIFEGDIVSWGENIESVFFNDCMFQTETSCIDSCMTVIGNIHQNPELLEK